MQNRCLLGALKVSIKGAHALRVFHPLPQHPMQLSTNPKSLALLPPPAYLLQVWSLSQTKLLSSRAKSTIHLGSLSLSQTKNRVPTALAPLRSSQPHTPGTSMFGQTQCSVLPCSCRAQGWASSDQMKLGWESLAPENCLIRNGRNFWFLAECRARHIAGYLKKHSK